MAEKRPKEIDYTIAWLCKFQTGRETEEVVFLTDDFDTIIKEYERRKKESKTPVIFVDHKLIGRGRILLSEEMIVLPEAGEVLAAPGRQPIIDAEDANAHPRRVQRLANEGRLDNADTPWMQGHNKNIAERILKDPEAQERV